MSDFKWQKEYDIGISSIDEQHKGFISLMDINVATITAESMQASMVEKLADYAKKHFTYEEGLLRKYGYSEEAKHKVEHEKFFISIADFKTRISLGKKIPLFEFYQFILNWLVAHIMREDKKYASFLINKGVQ